LADLISKDYCLYSPPKKRKSLTGHGVQFALGLPDDLSELTGAMSISLPILHAGKMRWEVLSPRNTYSGETTRLAL